MIDSATLTAMARKNQTSRDNVVREYCQHLFLSLFYQQDETQKILFKGGTALRILWGSPRFSEDLDFSSSPFQASRIEALLRITLKEISRQGCGVDLQVSKQTSGGYLGWIIFSWADNKIAIRVEISFRKKIGPTQREQSLIQNDFIPAYVIHHLSQAELLKEKFQATLSRSKPRDFFDLYFILRSRLSFQGVLKQYPDLKKTVRSLMQEKDIHFTKELKQFLPASHHALLKNFPASLEKELGRFF